MVNLRTFRLDMNFRDEAILKFLHQNADPQTRLIEIKLNELAQRFKISIPTMTRIIREFERAEYIVRHGHKQSPRTELEILWNPSNNTKPN